MPQMETNESLKTFYKVHKGIILSHLLAGYASPTLPFGSYKLQKCIKAYIFVINTISIFCTLAFVGGILFVPNLTFERVCASSVCTVTLVFVTVVGLMMLHKSADFNSLTERAAGIFHRCFNDPLDFYGSFEFNFNSHFKLLHYYTVFNLPVYFIVAASYVMPSYVKSFKSLGFSGDTELVFSLLLPFRYDESPNLEIAVVIEVLGITVAACRKLATECLLLMYMCLQIKFLRHLKHNLQNVFREQNKNKYLKYDNKLDFEQPFQKTSNHTGFVRSSDSSQVEKLKHWMILHQEVLFFGGQLTKAYNMIVALYMVSLTVIATLAAFTALKNSRNESGGGIIESAGVGFYYVSSMFTFCILCHFGSLITTESETVAQNGYFSEWFNSNKKIRTSMKIVFQRVQTPILITAFRSPSFDVSKETFLSFVKSTVSFYLALLQFGEKFKN